MRREKFKKSKVGKRLLFILSLFFLLFAVGNIQAAESPEFIKTKDWKLQKIGTTKMVLSCKAVFYNPNKAKAKLLGINFNVLLGDTKAGKINQIDQKVKIKKRQAFEIPLRIVIDPESNVWASIKGILSAVSMQDFVIHIRGSIQVRVLGIRLKIPVNESEELNLKELLIS